ncbi:MmyB family transcriptional regulator [Streptomyces griseofuscus]|uniref:MmyB family transcriptional regulator n=1 Tax=Streptomyces griseofuscus TaxID=146922 RepID=UPI0034531594
MKRPSRPRWPWTGPNPAWEAAARSTAAALSLYAGRHPYDARLAELIGELCVRDEGFRQWWADRDVLEYTHGTKLYRHPLVGELTFEYEPLTLPDDAGQALCLYTAQPDSPSDHALCLLAGGSAPAHPAEDRACSSSPPSP